MSSRKGWLMTCIAVQCPHCHSEQVVKRGKTDRGTQRYLCQNIVCVKGSFLLDSRNRGCVPEVKHTIIDMRLNASGIRDTARVLRISTDTVLSELKKKEAALESVEFIPLSFWYDAPLRSPYSDRRHDPWLVCGSPTYSPPRWSSWLSPA